MAVPISIANSAKPTQSDAMLVSSRAGRALLTTSTSGDAVRRSTAMKTTSATSETASSPSVRGSPQPQDDACDSGSSRQTRTTLSSAVPGREPSWGSLADPLAWIVSPTIQTRSPSSEPALRLSV